VADGLTVAKVDAAEIDEVTAIPDAGLFTSDIDEPVPVIGKKWFDMNLNFSNEVYAVKDCAGNLALIQPYSATYTGPPNHQLIDIKWRVKFDATGSADFSTVLVDSFVANNAYDAIQYYSFISNAAVTANDAHEIVLNGSSILLSDGTEAKNLGVTDINSVTTVSDDNWVLDDKVSWYDYNLNGMHRLTPKAEVYVIHTGNDRYVAMEIVGYNDDAGEFTVFWKYLD
jgi:hypothetical protein